MLSSLKESFRQLALIKQYLQHNDQRYKLVLWPALTSDYVLHDFIKKYDHLLKSNQQLSEELSSFLNVVLDSLHKGKRN